MSISQQFAEVNETPQTFNQLYYLGLHYWCGNQHCREGESF